MNEPPMAPPGLPTSRILIVDDNEPAALLLCRLLRMLGQEARAVGSPVEGLALLADFRPEIIFSDISMPEMDGYEFARRVRTAGLAPRPLLIAVTGYGQESDRAAATAAGFDRHFTTPVGMPMLDELLRSLPPMEARRANEGLGS